MKNKKLIAVAAVTLLTASLSFAHCACADDMDDMNSAQPATSDTSNVGGSTDNMAVPPASGDTNSAADNNSDDNASPDTATANESDD